MLKFAKITVNEPNLIVINQNGRYNVNGKYYAVVNVAAGDSGKPFEVETAAEMNNILEAATADDYGKIYKYVGESTEVYTKNSIYILER